MSQVDARLYCHGLGDCSLLGIAKPLGGTFWMLIDCGIHTSAKGGSARIDAVVADVTARVSVGLPPGTRPRLDVVVATHEHWDHISGFSTAAEAFAAFDVGEVWLAWTENPADKQARALDKFKGEGLAAVAVAATRMRAEPRLAALADGLDALLGFNFGIKGERSRDARDAVVALAPGNVRYLEPGGVAPLPAGLGVTAYILGPPRDAKLLGVLDSAADMYGVADSLNASFAIIAGDLGVEQDPGAPFDETEGVTLSSLAEAHARAHSVEAFVRDHYSGRVPRDLLPPVAPSDPDPPSRDQSWRRIDGDWLGAAADLALQLDSRTNNTSLVLAFDLGGGTPTTGGDVLLFAADAQIGNWQSWPTVEFANGTKGADLIRRTRFYKVGHHGSANATRRPDGLEAMVHPALQAFIPTDEAMAIRVGWGAIPEAALLKRLGEKACGGVVRSDKVDGALFVDYRFG